VAVSTEDYEHPRQRRTTLLSIGQFRRLLVDGSLVSPRDLVRAEQHAARELTPLADAIVALGLVREDASYATLAHAAGCALDNLEGSQPDAAAIGLVPERLARGHAIVPLRTDQRTLTYATSQPFNRDADRDIAFACGKRTRMVVATPAAIAGALERCYPKTRVLDALAARLRSESVVEDAHQEDSSASDSVVIELCNHLMSGAVDMGASDVHIECNSTGTLVRYRICGVLEPILTLPAEVSRPIRNRFKIMARADIAVRNKPQDGAFRIKVAGKSIDVRLSSLPTVDGEKLVMRVIDSGTPLQSLAQLGYDADTLQRLEEALARPDGLMLVTGPTGSGKTTALYAALGHLRTGRTNIVSVEDPVERSVPGVTQVPVNARAGNTFPAVLRALLRQDPNVIMVGEVRDAEVAQIVGQAAYTGHLVLTSMHTVDAATAITRLTNLGLEPFKVAECLAGVLAQRLLRVLCSNCKIVHNEFDAHRLGSEHRLPTVPGSVGPGCDRCKHTGYIGRVPVAELLIPSDQLRDAIVRGATAHEIRAAMRLAGSPNMRDHALRLVVAGITSIGEVNRVLSGGQRPQATLHNKPGVLTAAGQADLSADGEALEEEIA
jgi:type IV pilus assembly protein PilB